MDDSPEPMITMFVVEAGLIYLDKAKDGGFAAYQDGFSLLELTRKDHRDAGLDVTKPGHTHSLKTHDARAFERYRKSDEWRVLKMRAVRLSRSENL